VVAAFTLYACIKNGFQGALMAPTEILAKQHYVTLTKLFKGLLKVGLSTGSTKKGHTDFDIIVGTHALLQKNLLLTNPGVIVIDEQQRFGVEQRQSLREKAPKAHLLTMTATPIPRTRALTLYGQLEISALEELPFGSKKVRTFLVGVGQKCHRRV
jgi:ATP-dependent DNA helicase RecG